MTEPGDHHFTTPDGKKIPFRVLTEEEARFPGLRSFLFRVCTTLKLEGDRTYFMMLVVDGQKCYYPCFRNSDGEDLMKLHFPHDSRWAENQQYMAIAALTYDQLEQAYPSQKFGFFSGNIFIVLGGDHLEPQE